MPDAFVAVDATLRLHWLVCKLERQAPMAQPLGTPLEFAAARAALQQQSLLTEPGPIRRVDPVVCRNRLRKTFGEVAHSVSSEPKTQQLTGVTIGPEITMETSAPGTWLVDSPQI